MNIGIDLLKNETVVAWAALGIALAHAGINSVLYFRGSQIATEARGMVIYLQSGPKGSSLSGAVELVITNGSPWYGDALVGATAELIPAEASSTVRLPSYEAIVNPRFGASCPAEGRCLNLKSLSVQYFDDGIKSVPMSGAQVAWIAFEIPCDAFASRCNRFDGLASMQEIVGKKWTLNVSGQFVHEGKVRTSCQFGPLTQGHFDAVKKHQWTSFKCRRRS